MIRAYPDILSDNRNTARTRLSSALVALEMDAITRTDATWQDFEQAVADERLQGFVIDVLACMARPQTPKSLAAQEAHWATGWAAAVWPAVLDALGDRGMLTSRGDTVAVTTEGRRWLDAVTRGRW